METLLVQEHSIKGWRAYADKFGFVPDPMIVRAGEIFLNGVSGAQKLKRNDHDVWRALEENIGGIVDFFDIIVTREAIPLINYYATYDRMTTEHSVADLLPGRVCQVEIGSDVYRVVKEGAVHSLAAIDLSKVAQLSPLLGELDAFRYDWSPQLALPGSAPSLTSSLEKLQRIKGQSEVVARFLLGWYVFNGFAQASRTTHYMQPKRSRFVLGLTAVPESVRTLSHQDENDIFEHAEQQLKASPVEIRRIEPTPPVLPYLLQHPKPARDVRELLDRAFAFRESRAGRAYREVVSQLRQDGVAARRAEDMMQVEHRNAIAMLAPFSSLNNDRSTSLEIKLSGEMIGLPGAELSTAVGVPKWLRIWWNDQVPFGGLRKTLRRMWMANDSYRNFSDAMYQVWSKS